MKISILSNSERRREHSRLTVRLFPPPLSPGLSSQEDEPELVDLRDRTEQKKLCGGTEFFAAVSQEPWWKIILGVLLVAVLGVLVWILTP